MEAGEKVGKSFESDYKIKPPSYHEGKRVLFVTSEAVSDSSLYQATQ